MRKICCSVKTLRTVLLMARFDARSWPRGFSSTTRVCGPFRPEAIWLLGLHRLLLGLLLGEHDALADRAEDALFGLEAIFRAVFDEGVVRADVVAALHEALLQYNEEGGLPARHQRYADNCQTLLDGMAALGIRSFLPEAIQAPVIVTFHAPKDPRYQFKEFYERVKAKGFILYPGKLTQVETFRVGCIGHVNQAEILAAVNAIGQVLHEMEVFDI